MLFILSEEEEYINVIKLFIAWMTKIEDSSFAQSNFKTHFTVDLIKKIRFV